MRANIKIAIIDYGSGNLHSVAKAFVKAIEANPNAQVVVTDKANDLQDSTHIVLPGVGSFADCMAGLKSIKGMIFALETEVLVNKKPFLGICVGMQMLAKKGYEDGVHEGLGWLDAEVKLLPAKDNNLRMPHMGWNNVYFGGEVAIKDSKKISVIPAQAGILNAGNAKIPDNFASQNFRNEETLSSSTLFSSLPNGADFYFVHSYYFDTKTENIIAYADYGIKYAVAVRKGNIYGVQFHPEKSQTNGLKLIENFVLENC